MEPVVVVGGGLAGCECAWQLADAGIPVTLLEMKPLRRTPAQVTDRLAELVCSNSLRSANPVNAIGLLKQEMSQLDSLIIAAAKHARVPAGDALAVNRDDFSTYIEEKIASHSRIERRSEIVKQLPREATAVIATGPLTDTELAHDIATITGQERLYFYDAIAPIVDGDSINRSIAFEQSRYDKGDSADYLNCPLDEAQYEAFYEALAAAECLPLHKFEEPKYFQGCQPIEVIATSGKSSLLFGSMKPVGLIDPRTSQRPHAVVQLRKEDHEGRAFNLVGFQTKMKYGEQKRVFQMIPGLEDAEFLRLGAVHRNTYIDSPSLLDEGLRLRAMPSVRFAGQITGVEGYVESAACGLLVGRLLASDLGVRAFTLPPETTAFGALHGHIIGKHRIEGREHEPQNINWGMFPRVNGVRKREQKEARVRRAEADLEAWLAALGSRREERVG